jgi:hypothetical protein
MAFFLSFIRHIEIKIMNKLQKKILKADEYLKDYNTISDVLDDKDIRELISTMATIIKDQSGQSKNDQNMNELRSMPKDIDLLISSAKQVRNGFENSKDLEKRISNMSEIIDRVEPQYQALVSKKIKINQAI